MKACFPEEASSRAPGARTGHLLDDTPFSAAFPSLPHSPTLLLVLPGVNPQGNCSALNQSQDLFLGSPTLRPQVVHFIAEQM